MIDRDQLAKIKTTDKPGVVGTLTIGGFPGCYTLQPGLTGTPIVERGTRDEICEALREILLDEKPDGPRLGDVDMAVWTVRNDAGAIVGEFRTEQEALEYGSHLADANRDECYSVVVGRWNPIPSWQTATPVKPTAVCTCKPDDGPHEALRCPVHGTHAEAFLAEQEVVHASAQRRDIEERQIQDAQDALDAEDLGTVFGEGDPS